MPQMFLTSVQLIKAYANNMKILTAPCNLFVLHENGRESQNKWLHEIEVVQEQV